LFTLLVLPELADAQYFVAGNGDLVAGFRKTGSFTGSYELVVNIGSVTNFLAVPAGNSIPIGNYSPSQLSDAFSNYGNLQWSVSSMVSGAPNSTWSGFEQTTIWFTLPRTSANTQTTPIARGTTTAQATVKSKIDSIFIDANNLSLSYSTTNADNNTILVRELISTANNFDYAYYVADSPGSAIADFQGTMPFSGTPYTTVENTTPASFTSAVVSDLYQSVPTSYNDPNTGMTTGNAYYVGYFTLNPNGTMTFTRPSTGVAAPVAGFSGTPTNIFVTQSVTFTDASTGSITNWIWSFGDGSSVTNSSNISVNHSYSTAGAYTASLVVMGSGGSNTNTQTGYIVVTNAAPVAGFSGTPTNIFVTQSVVFTNTSTGSITNWAWYFGDGNSVTNTSSSNVTNIYATAGTYTVSLTVKGAGGSNTNTQANYIVVKPGPVFGKPVLSGSGLILSGVNEPAGQQYRILTSTNVALPLTNWTPVLTNIFASDGSYGYTNLTATNKAAFFILASP